MSNSEWTPGKDFKLLRYLEEGWTYEAIAKKMGCHSWRVQRRAGELGASRADLARVTYTLWAASRRFFQGVSTGGIMSWVERGWLARPRSVQTKSKDRKTHRFTREQLEAFLEVEEGWVAWKPENLVEPEMRAWATEMREAVGWVWVRTIDAMREIGYHDNYFHKLAEEGAIDISKCVSYAHAWWVRSDELERFKATVPDRGPFALSKVYGERVRERRLLLAESQVRFFESWGNGNCAAGVRAVADYMMSRANHLAAD